MEQFSGRVWLLGDDIDTDIIIPTEYLALKTVEDMKPFAFSPLRPELAGQITEGDIIVAGKNFGCGSSREQAPEVIKTLGIKCVIAKSYARIFFRNATNLGLPLVVCPGVPQHVKNGDALSLDLERSVLKNETTGEELACEHITDYAMKILQAGGIKPLLRAQYAQD